MTKNVIGFWTATLVFFLMILDKGGFAVENDCSNALGMHSGGIREGQVRASSSRDQLYAANNGRLGNSHAWIPAFNNNTEWLQIDLLIKRKVSGVITQGYRYCRKQQKWSRYGWETVEVCKDCSVTRFKIKYSSNGKFWLTYRDPETWHDMIFDGGINAVATWKLNTLPYPVATRYIRFYPVRWQNAVAMRVEVMGCRLSSVTCDMPPSFPNMEIVKGTAQKSSYGKRIVYACQHGYRMDAKLPMFVLNCNVTGQWGGKVQQCVRSAEESPSTTVKYIPTNTRLPNDVPWRPTLRITTEKLHTPTLPDSANRNTESSGKALSGRAAIIILAVLLAVFVIAFATWILFLRKPRHVQPDFEEDTSVKCTRYSTLDSRISIESGPGTMFENNLYGSGFSDGSQWSTEGRSTEEGACAAGPADGTVFVENSLYESSTTLSGKK
ncbi:hypothetical protein Bbelb_135270 [Branchiostoma belcheri]|nr:hypothetical protein Bbelb_135270 [Branchiostoma belcheri]